MNILFYLSRFPGWGGIETVTEILGNKLVDLGFQVSILTHAKQNRQSVLLERATYYVMPDEGEWDTPSNRAFAVLLVKENKYDVIIYQDSYANTEHIAIQMKRIGGGRLIVCEHSTPSFNTRKSSQYISDVSLPLRFYRRFYSLPRQLKKDKKRHNTLLQNADAYVVLSKSLITDLFEVCGNKVTRNNINKVYYINNPIIPTIFEKNTFGNKRDVVLFVGQINQPKRVDIMLDVWKHINMHYTKWSLQIVGDGPLRDELNLRANKESIDRVEFCGYQPPTEYYKNAKIFWMTSACEGWPMTLVEAMGAGCVPVGMNTFPAIQDIIDDGTNGFITPADNIDVFAEKTKLLIENDALRNEMGYAAAHKVKQFDVDVIVKQWVDLLQRL